MILYAALAGAGVAGVAYGIGVWIGYRTGWNEAWTEMYLAGRISNATLGEMRKK